jgi:hypothetical protein
MLRSVALVRTDVSEEITRAPRRYIAEDAILHSHRRENLKPYLIILGEEYKSCGSFQYPLVTSPSSVKIFSSEHFLKHTQFIFLSYCQRPCFIPIQNNGQDYSLVCSNFYVLDSKREDRRFWTEW